MFSSIPSKIALWATLVVTMALPARSQDVGTSQADLPSFAAAFSIENNTGSTIHYQVRWGTRRGWKPMILHSGRIMKHTYPLGTNPSARVPIPYVHFLTIPGIVQSAKECHMRFHAVGYAGYGAPENTARPKRYYFQFSKGGALLDLFERN